MSAAAQLKGCVFHGLPDSEIYAAEYLNLSEGEEVKKAENVNVPYGISLSER